MRLEVAAENDIIEEFEPEEEDNREEREEAEEPRGLRGTAESLEGAARRARDNAHPVSRVVPSLLSGQGAGMRHTGRGPTNSARDRRPK